MTGKTATIRHKGFLFHGRYGCKGVLYIWPSRAYYSYTVAEREEMERAGRAYAEKWRDRGQSVYFRLFAPVESKGSAGA